MEDDFDPEPSSATSEKHPASGPLYPGSSSATDAANKRRRGLGVVTPNACTECRKKRAKCDGLKPCGRCRAQKDVECVYEVPVRQSKDTLRNEIEQLRRQQQSSENVFSALVQPQLWEGVMNRLRAGQTVDSISDWLGDMIPSNTGVVQSLARPEPKTGADMIPSPSAYGGTTSGPGPFASVAGRAAASSQMQNQVAKQEYDQNVNSPWHFSSRSHTTSTRSGSHPDIMQWQTDAPPHTRVGSWAVDDHSPASSGSRVPGAALVLAPLDSPKMKIPASTWTNIGVADSALVEHLLALYFCWEYPTFASLSKEHFLKDFADGRNRYCSPILVNALLALGCRFSSQPNTRANPDDPYTSGDHFFKESLRLFSSEPEHHNLTTIQALGIMSIREASCGRDSESWYYAGQSVRMALEMGLHRVQRDGDEDEQAVQAATFWGAFALDHAWSLATGSLPQCSSFISLPPKPAIINDIEASLWIPYTDDGAPLQRSCEQPSNVRSVYKCFCELSELVHKSLYILHSPGRPVTSRDLLNIYTQYLNWYGSIPEVLRLGHNFTPAVLFAHMYYHFAILLLFRPLIKLRIIGSGILPRDVCSQAADAIQGLLRSYSQLYTLRRTPSFVPYFVLTSTIMHLALGSHNSEPDTSSPAAASNASTAKVGERVAPGTSNSKDEAPSPLGTGTTRLDSNVVQSLSQGIADLAEMAPCHQFAEQALHILRYVARKWNVEVEIPKINNVTLEEAERLVRPMTSSLNFFAPNFTESDFVCTWGPRNEAGTRGNNPQAQHGSNKGESTAMLPGAQPPRSEPAMVLSPDAREAQEKDELVRELGPGPIAQAVGSIDNPLFWPFPMQGRPMLPNGASLEEAGFAIL